MIVLKTDREIGYMRDAGKIVGQTLQELKKAIVPGVTTLELDRIADQYIRHAGAIPAFKGYGGFPANICTSVNEQVVHGIPGSRQFKIAAASYAAATLGTLLWAALWMRRVRKKEKAEGANAPPGR